MRIGADHQSQKLLAILVAPHPDEFEALKLIWVGEVVSIGVMEIAMNSADYAVGGMQAGSILAPAFWAGIAVAVPAGFLAAWPLNWWLLKRDIKKCH